MISRLAMLSFLTIVTAVFLPKGATTASAASFAIPGNFRVRLESREAAYSLGQPIELRLTLTNVSSKHHIIFWSPPYQLCKLIVLDGQARAIPKALVRGFGLLYTVETRAGMDYPPGKSEVQSYPDSRDPRSLNEWVDIRNWGYTIAKPGDYYIQAIPTFDVRSSASNVVHIRVIP